MLEGFLDSGLDVGLGDSGVVLDGGVSVTELHVDLVRLVFLATHALQI